MHWDSAFILGCPKSTKAINDNYSTRLSICFETGYYQVRDMFGQPSGFIWLSGLPGRSCLETISKLSRSFLEGFPKRSRSFPEAESNKRTFFPKPSRSGVEQPPSFSRTNNAFSRSGVEETLLFPEENNNLPNKTCKIDVSRRLVEQINSFPEKSLSHTLNHPCKSRPSTAKATPYQVELQRSLLSFFLKTV